MSITVLEKLKQIGPDVLTGYVRQDKGSDSLTILDWTVSPLSHAKIIRTTGGLYRFTGHCLDHGKTQPWSIILKVLNDPRDYCQDQDQWCYWKRELLAFGSGMFTSKPTAVSVPRSYDTTEYEGGGWIWMEEVISSTDQNWSMEHYHFAARQAGHLAGEYLGGFPMPEHPWLSTSFFRSAMGEGTRWASFMKETSQHNAWQHPIVQESFVEPLRSRVQQLWQDKEQFFWVRKHLPQVLCHNDFHRRNLMIRASSDGNKELVALDWAFCGPGALGTDLGELVGGTSYYFEIEPSQVQELEETVLDGYMAGLRDSGWRGDMRLARLGYCTSVALWPGATIPGWASGILNIDLEKTCGRPAQEVIAGWVTLCKTFMDRADEARQLSSELGLA